MTTVSGNEPEVMAESSLCVEAYGGCSDTPSDQPESQRSRLLSGREDQANRVLKIHWWGRES